MDVPVPFNNSCAVYSRAEPEESAPVAEPEIVPEVAATCGDDEESPRKRKRKSQVHTSSLL